MLPHGKGVQVHVEPDLTISEIVVQERSAAMISLLEGDEEGVAPYFHLITRQHWAVWFTWVAIEKENAELYASLLLCGLLYM